MTRFANPKAMQNFINQFGAAAAMGGSPRPTIQQQVGGTRPMGTGTPQIPPQNINPIRPRVGGTRPRSTPPVIDIKPPPQNYIGPRDAMGYPTSVKPTVTGAPAVIPTPLPAPGTGGRPPIPGMTGLGTAAQTNPKIAPKIGGMLGGGGAAPANPKISRMLTGNPVTKTVRPFGMKKGGKVSSASKRADGCAIKGKTKGKMV
jgi:hypothetical protein